MIKRERTLEQFFRRETAKRRGWAIKLIPATLVGFPDRVVLGPGPAIGFAELKKPGGKLTPAQVRWIQVLTDFGFIAKVIDSKEGAVAFLDEVLKWRR